MAVVMIDEYEVVYSSNTFAPRIWLKAAGRFVGQLVFNPNGSTLPPDTADSLFYHLEQYPHAVDLLRNEKPMYFHFHGAGSENGIKTTAEPVGEGE